MKHILKIIKKIYLFLIISWMFAPGVWAGALLDRLKNVGTGSEGAGFQEIDGDGDVYFAERLGGFIKILLSFLGIIFLILIIYGGFLWMTAAGNNDKVEKAKNIIVNSVVGLVIVMLAYAITWFVVYYLGESTGFDTGL